MVNVLRTSVAGFFVFLLSLQQIDGRCYFPAEFQGEFVTQSTTTATGSGGPLRVQYNDVTVLAESIPVWGHCHERIGNKVILVDVTGSNKCVRCFQIRLLSRNVLQVHSEGLGKCYTSEEAARATCPTPDSIASGRSGETLLFKTKGYIGDESITQEYCPLNGRFRFTYNVNDGTENSVECADPVSQISNCPYGFGLSLNFRRCSFGDMNMTFQCLGDWEGPKNQRYLALLDTQAGGDRERPRYRCALYREEAGTGRIHLAFSSDSTCQSRLYNASAGYETMILTAEPALPWPSPVLSSKCRFPEWSQGHWEHMYINGTSLRYQDVRNFKTYTGQCVKSDPTNRDRHIIYARTQCGDEVYNCIWINRRAVNILEFQMGLKPSRTYSENLCSDPQQFLDKIWITQGRLDVFEESPCPIAGEYTGIIPDDKGLCAKLYSDCNNPEIMFYSVSECYDQTEVYEGQSRATTEPFIQPGYHRQPRVRNKRQTSSTIYRISNPREKQPTSNPISKDPIDLTSENNLETTTLKMNTDLDSTSTEVILSISDSPRDRMYDPFVYNNYYGKKPNIQHEIQATYILTTPASVMGNEDREPIFQRNETVDSTDTGVIVTTTDASYDPWKFNGYNNGPPPSNRARWPKSYPRYRNYEQQPSYQSRVYDGSSFRSYNSNESQSHSNFYDSPHRRTGMFDRRRTPGSSTYYYHQDDQFRNYGMPARQPSQPNREETTTIPEIRYENNYPNPNPPISNDKQPNPIQIKTEESINSNEHVITSAKIDTPTTGFLTPSPISISEPTAPELFPRYSHQRAPAPKDNPETEEREYRCLGQWEEDGVMYTYTQRRDVLGYECFVGSVLHGGEIYIKEAGENCQRGVEPMKYGMKLTKQAGSCLGPRGLTPKPYPNYPPHMPTEAPNPWYPGRRDPAQKPTVPWKPITGQNQEPKSGSSRIHNLHILITTCVAVWFILTSSLH